MKNYAEISLVLRKFLVEYLQKSRAKKLIIGVSGGLDSAVVATLCAQAKPHDVHALIMPTVTSTNRRNLDDALELCGHLGIDYKIIEIEPILEGFKKQIAESLSNLRIGNLAARIRMCLLYDYSASMSGLVVGTSNKSERMLGYGTIYGDMACAINPIGDLFKTEIFEFAKFLKIDDKIIQKAPSADFWEGQSDEADIGYDYAQLDSVLECVERGQSEAEMMSKFDHKLTQTVLTRVRANEFKLNMPPIAKL